VSTEPESNFKRKGRKEGAKDRKGNAETPLRYLSEPLRPLRLNSTLYKQIHNREFQNH
jgi:hypothetical protein